MDGWLAIGLIQTVFVALVFARRSPSEPTRTALLAWLLIAFLQQSAIYFAYAFPARTPFALAVGLGLLPLLHGPAAYLYVRSVVEHAPTRRETLLHATPFLAFWAAALLIEALRPAGLSVDVRYALTTFHRADGRQVLSPGFAIAASAMLYPLAAARLIRGARATLLASRSAYEWVNFHWLTIWLVGHVAAFIAIFAAQASLTIRGAMPIVSWVFAAEVMYLGAFGVWRMGAPAKRAGSISQPEAPSAALADDAARLQAFMGETEIFRTPGLTLAALADAAGLAEASVSAAIKAAGYDHFFDFVNAHRCRFVQRRLAAAGKGAIG